MLLFDNSLFVQRLMLTATVRVKHKKKSSCKVTKDGTSQISKFKMKLGKSRFVSKLKALRSSSLHRLYDFFLIALFLVGLYLVVYPFLPRLSYEVSKIAGIFPSKNSDTGTGGGEIPSENRIVIPSISVDMPIVEGVNDKALDLGVWHRPGTGTPGSGNMVLTGHRVGYAFLPNDIKNKTSFYNLDKVKSGDKVIIYWEGKEYDYTVSSSEVVDANAMYVEGQNGDERLTMYTCYPLGSNKQRLVYYAKPEQNG